MTQKEAFRETHDRVRQSFARHKFSTFGDAVSWWHNASYEERVRESGEQGISLFSTEIFWITSIFGPKEDVIHKEIGIRKIPKLPPIEVQDNRIDNDTAPIPDNPENLQKSGQKKRRKSRRRF